MMRAAIKKAIEDVLTEHQHQEDNYAPIFIDAHHCLGVLREEYIEFEKFVFLKEAKRSRPAGRHELIQVAAVAIRYAAQLETEEHVAQLELEAASVKAGHPGLDSSGAPIGGTD